MSRDLPKVLWRKGETIFQMSEATVYMQVRKEFIFQVFRVVRISLQEEITYQYFLWEEIGFVIGFVSQTMSIRCSIFKPVNKNIIVEVNLWR